MSVFYDDSTDEIDSVKTQRYKKERVIYIDEPPTDGDDVSPNVERIGDNFTMEIHGSVDEQEENNLVSRECEQYISDKRQKTSGG